MGITQLLASVGKRKKLHFIVDYNLEIQIDEGYLEQDEAYELIENSNVTLMRLG